MADLHKLSVQEALNASGSGGQWTVGTVSTVHASIATGSTVHLSISSTAGQLGVYAAGEIYFNFSTTTTDCNTSNDLRLPADTLIFITVPKGLGGTIYFNHLGVSVTTVRTVEV